MRRMIVGVVSFVATLLVVSAGWTAAQARIRGTVLSSEDEAVAGAVLTITSTEVTDYSKTVEIKPDGSYSVLILDATVAYTFHVQAPGYVSQEQLVKVGVGTSDNQVDFVLLSNAEAAQQREEKVLGQPGYKELKAALDLRAQGDSEGAVSQLQQAVELRPDLLDVREELASLVYEMGDLSTALEYAEGCLELDAQSLPCLAVAANAAAKVGDNDKAEAFMARYQAANPEDPAVLYNQAVPFINNYDDAQARPLLEQCLDVDPTFANCLFEYGMLLLRTGEMGAAKQHLQRYLEVAPDGKDAGTARETLNYL